MNTAKRHHFSTPVPFSKQSLGISTVLLRHGLISNVTLGDSAAPRPEAFNALPIPQKRIWLFHKYRGGLPVLRQCSLISKGGRRVFMTHPELGNILVGKRIKSVPGAGMGEILVVKTPEDKAKGRSGITQYLDGWEAWRLGIGGEVVLRAS
jgi:ribosomal protein S8